MAGAEGLEPSVPVLETGGLPVNRRSPTKNYLDAFASLCKVFLPQALQNLLASTLYSFFLPFA